MNKKNNKITQMNFVETPSEQHSKNVFAAVEAELAFNRHSRRNFSTYWFSGALSCLLGALLYFQFINPVQKSTNLEAALSENLIMELAALSPDEVEIVEDLDFMEALDELSPEELEEILL